MIEVKITYGRPSSAEREAARDAALDVLRGCGITTHAQAEAACDAYRETIEAGGYPRVSAEDRLPPNVAWAYAEQAANAALTRGWVRPDGAACELSPVGPQS